MSAFDNYGEDIGGQSYSSYSDTPGDSGGGGEGPRTPIDPTKGFDIAPPPAERLSFLDRVKSFGGDIFKGITSLALGLSPQNLIASQFLPTVIGSLKDRLFPDYKTGINTIELDDRFTMPMNKPGIIGIDIPNFPPDMELYADASLKQQNKEILENLLNPEFNIDEALDKEEFKQNRQQELLNQILTG